jgi:hypothetical protein
MIWMGSPAQEWFAKAPQTMTIIKRKVSPVARFINHVDDLRSNAAKSSPYITESNCRHTDFHGAEKQYRRLQSRKRI